MQGKNLIFKKFKLINKIGHGSFGNIYSVKRIIDGKYFALKAEKKNVTNSVLESEAYFLFTLQGYGIPKFISFGHNKRYNILIEELLDKSLHYIFIQNKRKASLIDICLIGIQILDRLEWIHSKDIIYRDVKAENFLVGLKDPNVIYIIDFGLCKKFRSSKTGKHVLPKQYKTITGTMRYASLNVLKGKEPSRRDDLISLGYLIIYLFKGHLPWESVNPHFNREDYLKLIYLKENDGESKLLIDLPEEIIDYIKYTKKLEFEQNPDYSYLRSLFQNIILKKNLDYKKITFSWINDKSKIVNEYQKKPFLRKNNSQRRIYKKIKENLEGKIKKELSHDNYIKKSNIAMPINNKLIISAEMPSKKPDSEFNNLERKKSIIEKEQKNLIKSLNKIKIKEIEQKKINIRVNQGNNSFNNNRYNKISKEKLNLKININKNNLINSNNNSMNKNIIKIKNIRNIRNIRNIPIPKRNNIKNNIPLLNRNNIKKKINISHSNTFNNIISNNIIYKGIDKRQIYFLKNINNNITYSEIASPRNRKTTYISPIRNNIIIKNNSKINTIENRKKEFINLNRINYILTSGNVEKFNEINKEKINNESFKKNGNNKKPLNIFFINNNIMYRKIFQSPSEKFFYDRLGNIKFKNYNNNRKIFSPSVYTSLNSSSNYNNYKL